MMKPEPLPDGVSIEITASPYLLDQVLDRRRLQDARRVEAGGIELGPARRGALGPPRRPCAPADDLIARDPQDVVAEIDIKRPPSRRPPRR